MTAVLREDLLGAAKATALSSGISSSATSLSVSAGGLATWTPVVYSRIPVVINRGLADEEHLYAGGVSGDTLINLIRGQDGTSAQAHSANATVEHALFATHIDKANEFLSSPTAAGQIPVSDAADSWGAPTATPALTPSSLVIPTSAAPSQTTDGQAVWDSDDNLLTVGTGAGRKTMADLDSTQTLTGKTLTTPVLTTPTLADYTNAQHDHLDADDAGLLTQAATHQSPDTDTAASALHHTIGAGANQAAAGNHGHLTGAWSSYTPTLAAQPTNPNIGAGSASGHYVQLGRLVIVTVRIVFGAGATAGSGTYEVSLPVSASGAYAPTMGGGSVMSPGGVFSVIAPMFVSSGSVRLPVHGAGYVTNAVPFAWASGAEIGFTIAYESL